MKKAPTLAEASPYKSVAEELEMLRRTFRTASERYATRIETEIAGLRGRVVAAGAAAADQEKANGPAATKPSTASRNKHARALARVHDLRDMLTLLRTLQLKPADGRRKDLKKVESVVEELQRLAAGWA